MFVDCWDCHIKLTEENRTERPRQARKDGQGWKHTVDCCKKCLEVWIKKHPEYGRGSTKEDY